MTESQERQPNDSSASAESFPSEPLGIKNPLLLPSPLGQRIPNLQFMVPLGAQSITILDPSIFSLKEKTNGAIAPSFNEFPFLNTQTQPDLAETGSIVPTATTVDLLQSQVEAPSLTPDATTQIPQTESFQQDDFQQQGRVESSAIPPGQVTPTAQSASLTKHDVTTEVISGEIIARQLVQPTSENTIPSQEISITSDLNQSDSQTTGRSPFTNSTVEQSGASLLFTNDEHNDKRQSADESLQLTSDQLISERSPRMASNPGQANELLQLVAQEQLSKALPLATTSEQTSDVLQAQTPLPLSGSELTGTVLQTKSDELKPESDPLEPAFGRTNESLQLANEQLQEQPSLVEPLSAQIENTVQPVVIDQEQQAEERSPLAPSIAEQTSVIPPKISEQHAENISLTTTEFEQTSEILQPKLSESIKASAPLADIQPEYVNGSQSTIRQTNQRSPLTTPALEQSSGLHIPIHDEQLPEAPPSTTAASNLISERLDATAAVSPMPPASGDITPKQIASEQTLPGQTISDQITFKSTISERTTSKPTLPEQISEHSPLDLNQQHSEQMPLISSVSDQTTISAQTSESIQTQPLATHSITDQGDELLQSVKHEPIDGRSLLTPSPEQVALQAHEGGQSSFAVASDQSADVELIEVDAQVEERSSLPPSGTELLGTVLQTKSDELNSESDALIEPTLGRGDESLQSAQSAIAEPASAIQPNISGQHAENISLTTTESEQTSEILQPKLSESIEVSAPLVDIQSDYIDGSQSTISQTDQRSPSTTPALEKSNGSQIPIHDEQLREAPPSTTTASDLISERLDTTETVFSMPSASGDITPNQIASEQIASKQTLPGQTGSDQITFDSAISEQPTSQPTLPEQNHDYSPPELNQQHSEQMPLISSVSDQTTISAQTSESIQTQPLATNSIAEQGDELLQSIEHEPIDGRSLLTPPPEQMTLQTHEGGQSPFAVTSDQSADVKFTEADTIQRSPTTELEAAEPADGMTLLESTITGSTISGTTPTVQAFPALEETTSEVETSDSVQPLINDRQHFIAESVEASLADSGVQSAYDTPFIHQQSGKSESLIARADEPYVQQQNGIASETVIKTTEVPPLFGNSALEESKESTDVAVSQSQPELGDRVLIQPFIDPSVTQEASPPWEQVVQNLAVLKPLNSQISLLQPALVPDVTPVQESAQSALDEQRVVQRSPHPGTVTFPNSIPAAHVDSNQVTSASAAVTPGQVPSDWFDISELLANSTPPSYQSAPSSYAPLPDLSRLQTVNDTIQTRPEAIHAQLTQNYDTVIQAQDDPQAMDTKTNSDHTETASTATIEKLAREIYMIVRRRLKVEQERGGSYYSGRLPW